MNQRSALVGSRSDVTLYLIEPRKLVVEALRHVYTQDVLLNVIGDAPAVDRVEIAALRPDVIVLDLDGLASPIEDAINACESASPQSRICVLSAQARPRIMQRALSAKAAAYVVKDTSPQMMIEIIHSIAQGDYYADPRLAGAMLRRRSGRSNEPSELSGREFEIVRLIADGLSNREIGSRLSLSEKTVKNHVSHILAKLKVNARSGVAVYAVRNGIVS
jgi:DNA-binding NarL/FixJ family response regulator